MKWAVLCAGATALAISATGATGAAPAYLITPSKIDAVFNDYGVATPGCAVGVYSAGEVLYAKGYGMADLDLNVPITPETMFDIGSTSKQFTAAAIVLLANEAKLSLDDDVRKYVPELPDYGHVITIDDLLHHTSGLRDYASLLVLAGHHSEDFTDDDDALAIIAAQKALNFEPGTRWSYSNTGFFLLAVIVKRVTGQTLAEFAKARMFDPLGMDRTHFRNDHAAILKNRAVAYGPLPQGGFKIDMSNWDQLGDGGVNTNVLELARWDAEFYDPRVGGAALIGKLQMQGTLDDGKLTGYGRGLFLDTYRGLNRVHHGGAWAGYRAMLMRFPDQKLAIGLTCNVSNADTQRRAEAVADVVLDSAFTAAKVAPPGPKLYAGAKLDPALLSGAYVSDGDQSAVRLGVSKGALVLQSAGRDLVLVQTGPRRFEASHSPITVEFDADWQGLVVAMQGEKEPPYRRVTSYSPTPEDVATLAGRYYSVELGATWTIRVKNGVAYLNRRAVGESAVTAVSKDIWTSGRGFLALRRGPDGRVGGFDFSASRILRIHFDRLGPA
jgi:CubicO group peptidase (beta-lactamase class C family)